MIASPPTKLSVRIRKRVPTDLLDAAPFTHEALAWLDKMSPRAALRALSVVLERCSFYAIYADNGYIRRINICDAEMLRAVCDVLESEVKQ